MFFILLRILFFSLIYTGFSDQITAGISYGLIMVQLGIFKLSVWYASHVKHLQVSSLCRTSNLQQKCALLLSLEYFISILFCQMRMCLAMSLILVFIMNRGNQQVYEFRVLFRHFDENNCFLFTQRMSLYAPVYHCGSLNQPLKFSSACAGGKQLLSVKS